MVRSKPKNFYAVHIGHRPGIYKTWAEAKPQTIGFPGAKHKGFETKAEAEYFVKHGCDLPAGGPAAAREAVQVRKSGPMKAVAAKSSQLPTRVAASAAAAAALPSSPSSGSGSGTLATDFIAQHTYPFTIHDQADAIPVEGDQFPPNVDLTGLPERTLLQFKSSQLSAAQLTQTARARSKLEPPFPPAAASSTHSVMLPDWIPEERLDPNTTVISGPPKMPDDEDAVTHFIDPQHKVPSSRQLKAQFDQAIQADGGRQVPFLEYGLQPGWLKVYTDGSCIGNGQGAAVARAGVGAFFGYGDPRNLSEPLALHTPTDLPSNQKAEIQAVTESLKRVRPDQDVMILTDSQYVIKAMTEWIHNWRRKRFDGVANKEYFYALEAELGKRSAKVEWRYVPGHSGQDGNERADELAKAGAARFVGPGRGGVGRNKEKGKSKS